MARMRVLARPSWCSTGDEMNAGAVSSPLAGAVNGDSSNTSVGVSRPNYRERRHERFLGHVTIALWTIVRFRFHGCEVPWGESIGVI